MMKWDWVVGIVLGGALLLSIYKANVLNFSSASECFDYVSKVAQTVEKQKVGYVACRFAFSTSETESKPKVATARCILSKFNDIVDDTSGTKVVKNCAHSNDAILFGRALAEYFSPEARLREILEDNQRELKRSIEDADFRSRINNSE